MIEINLLPGARKPKRGAASSENFREAFSGALTKVKDPFLLVAVAGVVLGVIGTGGQYLLLSRRQSAADERNARAVADSTTYAAALAERAATEAQRDSVLTQFAIIETIDGQRYTWPHLMAELSRELPPYTWLVQVRQTSPVFSIVPPPADTSAAGARRRPPKRVEEVLEQVRANMPKVKLQVIGQTADIQAVTRYWRLLEASDFIENVNLISSDLRVTEGGDVVQFTLDMEFQKPPASAIRTVPLTVATR